jgi:hypothetical protein
MAWPIKCADTKCGMDTRAANIVDLVSKHRDPGGWFICASCGKRGYIEKRFDLQEPGEVWEPFLRGIVLLGSPEDTYQPFVFLVSSAKNGLPDSVWFSYYKDLRKGGGRLKLGYGPRGSAGLRKRRCAAAGASVEGNRLLIPERY